MLKRFRDFWTIPKKPPIYERFDNIINLVESSYNNVKDKKKLPEILYETLSDDARQLVKEITATLNKTKLANAKLADKIEKLPSEVKAIFKDLKLRDHQKMAEVGEHFFSWNSNWGLGRKIGGFIMVHAPEYPTYFIPAYTQARATGDAKELKKGEGYRGVITGCLEGIAVGAIVSGKKLKSKEMIPYMACGAALQYLSSKVFPVLGEKLGTSLYKRDIKKFGAPQVKLHENKSKIKEVKPIQEQKVLNAPPKSRISAPIAAITPTINQPQTKQNNATIYKTTSIQDLKI